MWSKDSFSQTFKVAEPSRLWSAPDKRRDAASTLCTGMVTVVGPELPQARRTPDDVVEGFLFPDLQSGRAVPALERFR